MKTKLSRLLTSNPIWSNKVEVLLAPVQRVLQQLSESGGEALLSRTVFIGLDVEECGKVNQHKLRKSDIPGCSAQKLIREGTNPGRLI